jgi:DNA-binding NtrC family response regulator
MRRILIVEDDDVQQMFYKRTLLAAGYRCDFASSLTAAENYCAVNDGYHLMIADLYLPDGTSPDFIWAFQQKFPSVKILVITGAQGIFSRIPEAVKNRVEVLFKPFEAMDFLETVKNLLS